MNVLHICFRVLPDCSFYGGGEGIEMFMKVVMVRLYRLATKLHVYQCFKMPAKFSIVHIYFAPLRPDYMQLGFVAGIFISRDSYIILLFCLSALKKSLLYLINYVEELFH